MAMEHPTNADLAAEIATQREELAALRAGLDRQPTAGRRPRRFALRRFALRRWMGAALAALLVALVPFGIRAATLTLSDLNTAAPEHRGNIQTIANVGITTGFVDPNNPNARVYYPKDNVTREEMASFLARLGGLNGNPPVVNAATAQTATTAQGVAPGAITPAGFSAAGSTAGQVLTSTGSGVAFQSPAAERATVRQSTIAIAATGTTTATTNCLAGEQATGGGYTSVSGITVAENRPFFPTGTLPTGWFVSATPLTAAPGSLTVYAVCIPAQ